MNRAALGFLLLAACSCGTTELQRKEVAVQTALDGAFLACQTALNDPRMTWDKGAKEYCLKIVSPDGCSP